MWLTMFRRFRELVSGREVPQWISGFGKPYEEYHWLGLRKLHEFTRKVRDGSKLIGYPNRDD